MKKITSIADVKTIDDARDWLNQTMEQLHHGKISLYDAQLRGSLITGVLVGITIKELKQ